MKISPAETRELGTRPRRKLKMCDSASLTKIAAECHRAKWQFDFSDEIKIGMPVARRALVKAFEELHRIGDLALKERDRLRAEGVSLPQKGESHD